MIFICFFFSRIKNGSPLLAAIGLYNWVHENNILGLTVEGRFPSEQELFHAGMWAFPRSFPRIAPLNLVMDLSEEEPAPVGNINNPMWERFHFAAPPAVGDAVRPPARRIINAVRPPARVEQVIQPIFLDLPDEEDQDDGYDDGFESDATVEHPSEVLDRLQIRDRNQLVWALF